MLSAHLVTRRSSAPPPPRPAEAGAQATHWADRQSPRAHSACHEELGKYKVGRLGSPPFLSLERVAPTDMDVHRARQTPCHQTHPSWAPDARTGEVAWQLLPFLCVPFYLHFLCALSTCRSNPRRDPSANLNQEVRVTTPRVQKRLLPSAQAQDTYPVSQQRCSVPVGEALGPAGLGYWEVGRMGERVGGRGRTAAHHLQIPLTKQPNANRRKQGVQQKENKPKMGLGG